MKRALAAHSITYSALSDLYMEAFLKSESAKSNAEHKTVYDSVIQASIAMNTICKEDQYSELGTKHKDLVTAMETDNLQERLLRFDEVMQGNFCVNKNEIPFCAIGPDHAIEHVNKLMKIRGGLKGLTQQPAAMARWFLVAPELSRLATRAEHMVEV